MTLAWQSTLYFPPGLFLCVHTYCLSMFKHLSGKNCSRPESSCSEVRVCKNGGTCVLNSARELQCICPSGTKILFIKECLLLMLFCPFFLSNMLFFKKYVTFSVLFNMKKKQYFYFWQYPLNKLSNKTIKNGYSVCVKGQSFSPYRTHSILLFLGYHGEDCSLSSSRCVCDSEGTMFCDELENAYRCVCHHGHTGVHCETPINHCVDGLCQHGSTCVDLSRGFKCDCLPGRFILQQGCA